jgi:anti-sigma regulatory factor (Ser/Thr protein kinase)
MITVLMDSVVRAPRSVRCETFPASKEQVAHARRLTRETLPDHPQCDLAVLLVSELTTNVVLHSGEAKSFTLVITETESGDLWVAVSDDGGGDGVPRLRAGGPTDLDGRGLRIVDQTATRWGITRARGQSAVWFEMTEQPEDPACPLAATT